MHACGEFAAMHACGAPKKKQQLAAQTAYYNSAKNEVLITGDGNVLMDIVAFLDEATKQKIRQLGGVHAIYFSHPHYYGTLDLHTTWSPC